MAKYSSTVRWVTGKVSAIIYVLTFALQMYAFFDTILSILTNSDKYKILFF